MTEFWVQTWASVDWQVSAVQWAWFGGLLVWLWLIWPADDIKQVLADKSLSARMFFVSVAIIGLWLLNASVMQGMHAHFLGLVTVSMLFGWRLASLLVLPPVLFFCTFVMKQPGLFGVYAVVAVLAPIFLSFIFYIQTYKHLPKHLFVFIFFGGFFNAGLMLLAHILLWAGWLWANGAYDWSVLADNYLVLIPLLGFPEALLNGMALTLLVVYRPEWLFDYSDKQYLWGK